MLSDIKDSTSQISQLSMTLTSTKDLTPKQRLRKELLKNYDKSTHPVEDHNQTIQVQLGMALIHIDLDNTHGNLLTPSDGNQIINRPFRYY